MAELPYKAAGGSQPDQLNKAIGLAHSHTVNPVDVPAESVKLSSGDNVQALLTTLASKSETDPVFSAWISSQDFGKYALKTSLDGYYTKTESDLNQTTLVSGLGEVYYTKSEVDQAIGNVQVGAFTPEQIEQIIAALPDADIITQNELDTAIAGVLTQAKGYTDSQVQASQALIADALTATQNSLSTHMATDRFRWQDVYDTEKNLYVEIADVQGLLTDDSNTVTVPASSDAFVANDDNGGIFGISLTNTASTFTVITINGETVYTSEGLTSGISVTKWYRLRKGDSVQATNATEFIYTPLIVDPNGAYQERQTMKSQIVSLTSQVLSMNARLDGKELDRSNPQDIESASQGDGFIVPSGGLNLGGQITGNGINALLGSSGHVTVGGETVYDNRGALGLKAGLDAMQPVDVQPGEIVVSSGMNDIWFTAYIPMVQ